MSKKTLDKIQRGPTANELADHAEAALRNDDPRATTSLVSLPQRMQNKKERRRKVDKGPAPKPTSPKPSTSKEVQQQENAGNTDAKQSKPEGNKPPLRKISIPLPARGQPGGLDDPLRRGLSGAKVKWYLRFLAQGLQPEEARAKAAERNTQDNPVATAASKRGNTVITPPQPEKIKKGKWYQNHLISRQRRQALHMLKRQLAM